MALTQVSTGGIKDGQVQTADIADAQITAGKLHADALDRTYTLGADGSNHYTFTGEGLTGAVNDPTLYLTRGKTYRFVNGNSAGAHPFRIQTTVNGSAGTEYNTGVTNNGGAGGSTIVFEVPHAAPDVLYYQCTSHGSMGGVLYITGALADGGVTTAKLAADAVTGAKIADDAINSEHYVDGSIDTAHIADAQITAAKLADDAVTTAKIVGSAVITGRIADDAVTTAKIADAQITSAKLGASAVTTGKINDLAVTAAKIADTTITSGQLAASSVTTSKINDGAITQAKLAAGVGGVSSDSNFNTIGGTNTGTDFNTGGGTASRNTCFGYAAGTDISTGDGNTLIGYQAGDSITTGSNNIAIGQDALSTMSTQSDCVAIGKDALKVAQNGAQKNVCIGYEAGMQITTGDNNIGIGNTPLGNLISGSDNIGIGNNAYFGNTYNGNIMLASGTLSVTQSYQMMFGSNAQGRVYNNYNSNASWGRYSDVRKKKDILPNTDLGLDFVNDLKTCTYKWKAPSEIPSNFAGYDPSKTEHSHTNKMYGFIAQEVKQSLDKYQITDFDGWTVDEESEAHEQGVSYEMFVVPLVKAVQELSAKVKVLEDEVAKLKAA